jgi:hypothetical protein
MRISRVIISAVFIMIVGACFTAAAKEGAVPVLSFELEDGTQILDQDNVIKASLINRTDNLGNLEFMIEITFDEEGKEAFQRATVGHVGEVIRILVNGETVSSPVVQEPVTEGKCVLTGGFTQSEAEELIRVLDPEKAAACGDETETEGLAENRPDSEGDAYDSLYEISEILKRIEAYLREGKTSDLSLQPEKLDMLVSLDGEEDDYYEELTLRYKGERVDPKEAKWESDHPEIAEVDEYGWVTSTGVGTAIITAQYKGVSAECVIDVERKITSDTRGE